MHRLLLIPPPIRPEDRDSSPPDSILLDPFGYLSDRTNATTADGCRSWSRRKGKSRKRILVTFWVASPPRVSCFTVHCPGLKPDAFGDMPKVFCAADDLVLFRVPICHPGDDSNPKNIRYFVYQAGTKTKPPSVKLVRKAADFRFFGNEAALLRCRDHDMFYLAVLHRAFVPRYDHKQFQLHLYNSKTQSWSTKLMRVDLPDFVCFSLNKVITIGGKFGSVGWVDLWRGILICDLLVDDQCLRYIPLPSPVPNSLLRGYPMCLRNIIVLDGYIKFFEMHNHVQPDSGTGINCINEGCLAAMKKLEISSISSGINWEEDCAIKFSEVPVSSPVYAQMLLQEGDDTKPTLKRINAGYPALSLHDRDVVYIMHTPDHCEDKACVIALDMRNKSVKGVADFGSGRPLGYGFTYLQCEISKHLGVWSSTRHVGNAAETGRRDGSLGRGKEVLTDGY